MRSLGPAFVMALVASTLFSGCFGSAEAVYIPDGRLVAGWEHTVQNETQEAAKGNVDIIINRYDKGGETSGQIHLLGVTDVPFVNEHEHIREQVDQQARAAGVTLTQVDEFDLVLENGKKVAGVEYDIQKDVPWGTSSGKAWRLEWDTGGFSAGAFGWATTEHEGLLGKRTDTTTWDETRDLMKRVQW